MSKPNLNIEDFSKRIIYFLKYQHNYAALLLQGQQIPTDSAYTKYTRLTSLYHKVIGELEDVTITRLLFSLAISKLLREKVLVELKHYDTEHNFHVTFFKLQNPKN